jgi:transposase InsO family protein
MEQEIRKRLSWIKMYQKVENAGVVCLRCGISRPTLRKWLRRYASQGEEGLKEQSRRPHRSPKRKMSEADRQEILGMRNEGKGARRIQSEMRLYKEREFSLASIHKVLSTAKVAPLVRRRRPTSESAKRYSKLIPGERIQIDTMKIASHLYQYTAVDDCSRWRVLGLYPQRNAQATLLFLDRVIEEMPFPIQRIQTDRGTEFFAEIVQRRFMQEFIKFRPIPPRSPHLNGKVERSQLTDRIEFWSRYDCKETRIHELIEEWQFEYNYRRPHGSLNGKPPAGRLAEIGSDIPLNEEVAATYDSTKEILRFSDSKLDRIAVAFKPVSSNSEFDSYTKTNHS